MNAMRRFLCLFLIAVFVLGAVPARAVQEDDARFAGKTWEEVIDEFFTANDIHPERLSLGYYNTVTGETHYHNGDQYRVPASMYKVALNMYWSEQVYLGNATWEDMVLDRTLAQAQETSIVNSNNEYSFALMNRMGTYRQHRDKVAPYYGVDPETVDPQYFKSHQITAEQMIHCLKLLYTESERFPNVLELMGKAEPDDYFNSGETTFPVAQKYGYIDDQYALYINSCGVVYTDEPILLVMLTCNVTYAQKMLGAFCDLMADYSQYHHALRLAEEAEAQRLAEEAEAKRLAEEAEAKRLAEEAEAKRLAEEAEAQRLAEEAEAQRLAEEAEAKRLAQEAEAKRLAQEARREALRLLPPIGLCLLAVIVLLVLWLRRRRSARR